MVCSESRQKWVDMCSAFGVNVEQLKVALGKSPDLDLLSQMLKPDVKAVLINMHETSTGYLYDIEQIGRLTNEKDILLIVDGVSSIGADEFTMDKFFQGTPNKNPSMGVHYVN